MKDFQAFWRDEPLSKEEKNLLDTLFIAHAKSAGRGNFSGEIFRNVMASSGSYAQAMAAAILTTGGVHAPIVETMQFLSDRTADRLEFHLQQNIRVPGWGNSFVKGRKDPLWEHVDALLDEHFHAHWAAIERVTQRLHSAGKLIFPNPSAYTATTALVLQIPPAIAPWLFVAGRLDAWTKLVLES